MLGFFKRRSGRAEADSDGSSVATLDKIHIPLTDGSQALTACAPQRVSPFREPQVRSGDEAVPADAYTHGFESIYAMENVDLKTVRPMGHAAEGSGDNANPNPGANIAAVIAPAPVPEPVEAAVPTLKLHKGASQKESKPAKERPEWISDQLELDLGPEYRGWIEPFSLSQPIQTLGLSHVAEKALIDNRKTHIRDLLTMDRKGSIGMKGLGQGHIDEVLERLSGYFAGAPRQRSQRIDLSSLILAILGQEDKKASYLLLEHYDLADLIPLNSSEEAELKHLSVEQRAQVVEDLKLELESERRGRLVREKIQEACQVFITPWIRGRQGLASGEEVEERLERQSTEPKRANNVLRFLADTYYQGEAPYEKSLIELDKAVFTPDKATRDLYRRLMHCVQSYFYRPNVRYTLQELLGYVEREAARRWQSYEEGFVEKALRLSSQYRVFKGPEARLMVRRVY